MFVGLQGSGKTTTCSKVTCSESLCIVFCLFVGGFFCGGERFWGVFGFFLLFHRQVCIGETDWEDYLDESTRSRKS